MNINLSDFYSRLITIAIILLLGVFIGRRKMVSNKTHHELVELLLSIFMPASLLAAFPTGRSEDTMSLFASGLLAGIIVMFFMILISRVIFSKHFYKGELRYEAQFALIFNNATFLGYPIIKTTFGETGIVPYCGFIIAFNIALFSYGVYLFERKITKNLFRKVATNPNIIAVVLGLLLYLSDFSLPEPISDAVKYTGNVTTALSLICIGILLSRADLKSLFKKRKLALTALLQLVLGPIIAFALLSLLHFPQEVVVVCTIIQTLPTATSLSLFASRYGGNVIESSELVTLSTILSMLTMPIMANILVAVI